MMLGRPSHIGREIHHGAHDYMYTSYLRNENVLLKFLIAVPIGDGCRGYRSWRFGPSVDLLMASRSFGH